MAKKFVGSLSWNTDERALREAFSPFGTITEAAVISDRDSGRSRGFGFVTFEDDDAADKAVAALNNTSRGRDWGTLPGSAAAGEHLSDPARTPPSRRGFFSARAGRRPQHAVRGWSRLSGLCPARAELDALRASWIIGVVESLAAR
jgi:hypothetical protein